MKIFNEENSSRVVYVQLNDLAAINASDLTIPANFLIEGIDSNRHNFVRFDDPSDVLFLEGIDWIVDYKEYRNKTVEEFNSDYSSVCDEINEIAEEYNGLDDEERRKCFALVDRYHNMNHKKNSIEDIYSIIHGSLRIDFPIVPDADGFLLEWDGNDIYRATGSFENDKIIISKIDGSLFEKGETIPYGFIKSAVGFSLLYKGGRTTDADGCSVTASITDDHKYVVASYAIENMVELRKGKAKKEKKTTAKQFFKSLFEKR